MYISTPKEIDQIIRRIPKGKLITTKEIAKILANKHGADYTCGLTTGIFSAICANASMQELEEGKNLSEVTPYWRVLKSGGKLYDKYLGNTDHQQKEMLEKEGFKFEEGGRKHKYLRVKGWKDYLVTDTLID
jgi:alkylated DNA nucleotide flippase Atl1